MSLPRKAVFAPTQPQARALARAFGLEPDEWSSFGFNTILTEREFDRIVVQAPINPTAHDIDFMATLRTRFAEKGVVEIITCPLSAAWTFQVEPAI